MRRYVEPLDGKRQNVQGRPQRTPRVCEVPGCLVSGQHAGIFLASRLKFGGEKLRRSSMRRTWWWRWKKRVLFWLSRYTRYVSIINRGSLRGGCADLRHHTTLAKKSKSMAASSLRVTITRPFCNGRLLFVARPLTAQARPFIANYSQRNMSTPLSTVHTERTRQNVEIQSSAHRSIPL